jgi:hypothetical protein
MHCLSDINLAKYLAVLLRPFVGQSEHHLKNSEKFVQRKQSITLQSTDILASFDVVSVFTMIPLENTTTNTFTEMSQADCISHETCPNNHVFSSRRLVLPTKGRSVHRISPGAGSGKRAEVVELFEQRAKSTVVNKATRWYRYRDKTCVMWPHGKQALQEFSKRLNCIHQNINFTMEMDENAALPFLDVLVTRNWDGTIGHMVYRKITIMNFSSTPSMSTTQIIKVLY